MLAPLKKFSTVVGCNAIFRDYNIEYISACDKHMAQEAANTCGKNTTIFTRDKWHGQFAMWPNVKKFPELPYQGSKRADEPFHWGSGPYAGLIGLSFKPKVIFLIGFDLGKSRFISFKVFTNSLRFFCPTIVLASLNNFSFKY